MIDTFVTSFMDDPLPFFLLVEFVDFILDSADWRGCAISLNQKKTNYVNPVSSLELRKSSNEFGIRPKISNSSKFDGRIWLKITFWPK